MTKEQKLLLLFVLIIAGAGAGLYISKEMKENSAQSAMEQTDTTSTETVTPVNSSSNETTNPTSAGATTSTSGGTTVGGSINVNTGTTVQTGKIITENTVYRSPSGQDETIHVKLTVDGNGTITDVIFTYDAPASGDRESEYYLSSFNKAFNKSVLVGKKLSGAQISRTGGASLVTKAFNKSLVSASAKV